MPLAESMLASRKQLTFYGAATGFLYEMKSGKKGQNFHTDDMSLPRS